MKIYQKQFDYDYSFPTVTLAYFLRYPNPYSKHVVSTDVLDRYIDPKTKRLHTLRLHLKRSKVPAAILKFLPRGMAGPGGASQSYILERSTVDVREGWMETESRNLEWTGVLSVIEKQTFRDQVLSRTLSPSGKRDWTTCMTTVTFVSKLGQGILRRKKQQQQQYEASAQTSAGTNTNVGTGDEEEPAPKQGFFASWSTAGIQRTIELVGMTRSKTAQVNSAEGMKLVLERLRNGGIVAVLEGMRRDRLEMMGGEVSGSVPITATTTPTAAASGGWKQVWQRGRQQSDHKDDDTD